MMKHKWAIFLAVLVGLIVVSPQAYFRLAHQDIYQGLNLPGAEDQVYLNRIQEVRDGHYSLANSVLAEGKNLPYLQPPLSEIISACLGKLLGLNLVNTVLLERFLFPFLLFLLIYALVFQLTQKKIIALVVPSVILLATNLLEPSNLWDLLINQKAGGGLNYNRLISPQVHAFFFFGFLLLFWLFFKKKKKIYSISAGIILGLSFYTFPYTWTYLYVFLGLLAIFSLLRKKWPDLIGIVWVGLIGLVVAIPYFYNLYQAINHPFYQETSLRFGTVSSHQLILGSSLVLLLGLFLLFFSKEDKTRFYFSLSLVFAPFLVLNQQLITGRMICPAHYHWFIVKPLVVIFILIIIFELIRNKKRVVYFLAGLILIIAFYNGILLQKNFYQIRKTIAIENQRYGPVFQWLNNNSKKDEVVMANQTILELVHTYTHLNSLWASLALYSLISTEKLLDRYLYLYRFDGLKPDEALDEFSKNRVKISLDVYGEYYRKGYGGHDKIPDEVIVKISEMYEQSLKIPLKDALRKYQVDYLIWDKEMNPDWTIIDDSFTELLYQSNNIFVYKAIY